MWGWSCSEIDIQLCLVIVSNVLGSTGYYPLIFLTQTHWSGWYDLFIIKYVYVSFLFHVFYISFISIYMIFLRKYL